MPQSGATELHAVLTTLDPRRESSHQLSSEQKVHCNLRSVTTSLDYRTIFAPSLMRDNCLALLHSAVRPPPPWRAKSFDICASAQQRVISYLILYNVIDYYENIYSIKID